MRIAAKLAFVVTLIALWAPALATPILPVSATPVGNGISAGNFSLATDGNIATGYLVTNTNANAQGFFIQFDFDVSGYSQVSAFTLSFTGVYTSDNSAFQSVRFGASPFSDFTSVSTPIGQQISFTLVTTSAGSGFSDTDNYISGNTLSVYLQTDLGSGPGTFTAINTREISADIQGTAVNAAPEPATLALITLGIALLGGRTRKTA